ncbi:hypothetical protein M5C97_16730 [Acidovorax sp. NCPPB 3859]|nr:MULTISPECIES: hypothetical protein [unclassified Acidovorax]MDA8450631.1 hypothetical protein [Acidovorax sp. GBBC 3297]MDA8460002.1 hypothetical protein [Acidovorax sp. GBBC 3333]MDA8465038.1 hypothetical protein [Acidovorax sp. GBBC 3332]MDA8470146.1 hypothetical protein [Acidovorax sp. GBBC 3299]WCM77153.1 hypothetical protein M5C94_16685 [Acidovorax sp. GBBC 712]
MSIFRIQPARFPHSARLDTVSLSIPFSTRLTSEPASRIVLFGANPLRIDQGGVTFPSHLFKLVCDAEPKSAMTPLTGKQSKHHGRMANLTGRSQAKD